MKVFNTLLLLAVACLITFATAGPNCHVDKMNIKFYKDKQCKTLNERRTKRHGGVPKRLRKMFAATCFSSPRWKGRMSMAVTCSPDALKMQMFKGGKCDGKVLHTKTMPFNKCIPKRRGGLILHPQ